MYPFEFVGMVHVSKALFFSATACKHLRSALLEAASSVALRFGVLGGFEVQLS